MSSSKPVVVVGDGWAALGTVGFLVSSGVNVTWIAGSGARILSPLSSLEAGPGVSIWKELASKLNINCGETQSGVWMREFRNKAFREPMWSKSPTPEARSEVRNEVLWMPETRLAGIFESRWENKSPLELEEEIRALLLNGTYPHLKRIEELPIVGFKKQKGEISSVILGSGTEVECSQVVYADRWGLIPGFEGLPKPLVFLRKREPVGVLQACFLHEPALGAGLVQSFFAPLFRAASNEIERRVWGHFFAEGKRSIWTFCLTAEEMENNQEIAKKLRRLKGTLDRIFQGSDLIPAGKTDFASTIAEEQVRFEEEAFFSEGEAPAEPITLPEISGLVFLTDGYGPSAAMAQVGTLLGIVPTVAVDEPLEIDESAAESSEQNVDARVDDSKTVAIATGIASARDTSADDTSVNVSDAC